MKPLLKSEEKQRLYVGSSPFCISADNSDDLAVVDNVHSCFYLLMNRAPRLLLYVRTADLLEKMSE